MKVVNQRNEANMGSATVTHKTMAVKSNTKGVPVVPSMVSPQTAKSDGGAHSESHKLPR